MSHMYIQYMYIRIYMLLYGILDPATHVRTVHTYVCYYMEFWIQQHMCAQYIRTYVIIWNSGSSNTCAHSTYVRMLLYGILDPATHVRTVHTYVCGYMEFWIQQHMCTQYIRTYVIYGILDPATHHWPDIRTCLCHF